MTFFRTTLVVTALALAAMAHPMGNFSVNHYSRLYFRETGVQLTYVLDLAEIPTFQLLASWQADSKGQAAEWVSNLALVQDGRKIQWKIESVASKTADGAGGMPVLHITIVAKAALGAGKVAYEDRNFPGRAGWKEIVIDRSAGTLIRSASQGARDLSAALTHYPTDPSITPPQDLAASIDWAPAPATATAGGVPRAARGLATPASAVPHRPGAAPATPAIALLPQPAPSALATSATIVPPQPALSAPATSATNIPPQPAPSALATSATAVPPQPAPSALATSATAVPPQPAPTSFAQQQPSAAGTVVAGDFLSRMLPRKDLGWKLLALCVLAAFGVGAMHAMSPGHGKTIVAAYLVGSRGTVKHAALLGFVVTFTHTFTVFLLGLGVLFFQQYVVPEKIVPALGGISGLSIVVVGLSLLYRRAQALMEIGHGHRHPHHHDHHHGHSHSHVHSHGGTPHSHTIEGEITPAGLIALGVSGGLVPCPSALILMLSAIALGRPGFGLVLLVGFSAGLALVLMAIGMLALYARHLLPDSGKTARNPAFRLIPVFSAVVVICLGLMITAVSAGWLQPMRFLS